MVRNILRFWKSESGATAIEYALIAGFLSIVIIASVTLLGENLLELYEKVENSFPQ
jgi:pilus assembly protein Flp/PilA